MSEWNLTELDEIAEADKLDIVSVRPDGTLRPYRTIWVVRVGDDLYVRSWRGRSVAFPGEPPMTRSSASECGTRSRAGARCRTRS